ncbi:hypothetical protein [Helicobacter pylori]|uniref:hypothetical protein n=1 Tax=Helicobacter pylori TaxID=210 RepID=UPI001920B56B|nr:hypothetical protein [Helicobacter pylori]QQW61109.1 hypothetical protein HGI43_04140 [Helicobacter pylori]
MNTFTLYKRDYKGEATLYLNYYDNKNKRFKVSLRKATDCVNYPTAKAIGLFLASSLHN